MSESERVNVDDSILDALLSKTFPSKNPDSLHLVPLGLLVQLYVMQGPGRSFLSDPWN